jgi:pyruvate dehydrogenase E1 component beta subunit
MSADQAKRAEPPRYWQAINTALREEMERDPTVMLIGEDVGVAGGTFGATRGLLDEFGPERIRDAPISEQAIVGAGVGAALVGMRPVVEILLMDFLGIASDMVVNQAAKFHYFSGGKTPVPLVIKTAVGSEVGMGAQHSQSLEGWYAQVPGLKVCWPGTVGDAKALLKAAIRDDNPVLFVESLSMLRVRGEVGGPDVVAELGRAEIVQPGSDVTMVGYGAMRAKMMDAVSLLADAGVSVEVIDLKTIVPWDRETVFASVARTNRCVVVTEAVRDYGPSGEIASEVGEHCFDDLDAPVTRVTSPSINAPHFAQYDAWRVPQGDTIAAAVKRMLGVSSNGDG